MAIKEKLQKWLARLTWRQAFYLIIASFFVLLFAVGLLLLRYYGVPLEQPLDRALGWVGLKAGSGEF